jgi:hypothetical protein
MAAVTVAAWVENISKGVVQAEMLGTAGVGASDTTIGSWMKSDGIEDASIEVRGIAGGGVVQVYGTNIDDPADATDYQQLGNDITADDAVAVEFTYKYLKVKVSTASTSTVKATLVGTRR